MPRNTRINDKQLKCLYWPRWRAAEKVLLAAGFSKEEADEKRKDIHRAVTGDECSSKDLTNRTLDEVLRHFAAISNPRDGRRQADLADGPAKRVRWQISQLRDRMNFSDAYVETLAIKMHRRSLVQCDEDQLKTILAALTYHENRHTNQPLET